MGEIQNELNNLISQLSLRIKELESKQGNTIQKPFQSNNNFKIWTSPYKIQEPTAPFWVFSSLNQNVNIPTSSNYLSK